MPHLHETMYGRRFFEHELPELNKSLKRIADALESFLEKETIVDLKTNKNKDESINDNQKIFENFKESEASKMIRILLETYLANASDNLNKMDNISFLKALKLKDVLSPRISNSLSMSKYPKENLYNLVTSSERELLSARHFGIKCLSEVEGYLHSKGLELNMTDEEIQKVDLSKLL